MTKKLQASARGTRTFMPSGASLACQYCRKIDLQAWRPPPPTHGEKVCQLFPTPRCPPPCLYGGGALLKNLMGMRSRARRGEF